MTLTWAQMKSYILEGILKDASSEDSRYTPEQLLAYARWACAELSLHTAQADIFTIETDGTTNQFVLPSDMVDSISKCGLVGYDDGKEIDYLPYYKRMPDVLWPSPSATSAPEHKCYWEWPTGQLTLGFTPVDGKKLLIYYFKIWPAPTRDEDILSIPQWMEQPFVYLFSAFAMEPTGTQFANIRGWNRKTDSGNPEDNPAEKHALYFIAQANRILSKTPPQDRENFYFNNPRKGGR